METPKFQTIDAYIASFPAEVQAKLTAIRETARRAAPDATEIIRYGMPTIDQDGYLLYFAAYKKHISLYPAPPPSAPFFAEVLPYLKEKATLQIPINQEVPLDLVEKLVRYRLAEKGLTKV